MTSSKITVEPFVVPESSQVDFGATVSNVDFEHLTGRHGKQWENTRRIGNLLDADFEVIRKAFYTHQVLVFPGQSGLSARAQYELTQRFDPAATGAYGHGTTLDSKRSVLHPDLRTIPHQPQVQVIGHGQIDAYEGLRDLRLRHPHHRTFHATAVPAAEDRDFTRFYRWHIDAALYDLAPPVATTLLAVRVPAGRRQTCRYDDGSGDTLDVPLGTTAFVSGEAMYAGLSAADQAWARTTRVEYAPHPYVWMSGARARPDGLGLVSEGRETPLSALPPFDAAKVQVLPLCWRNPTTGRLALQAHPAAARRLHLADGTVVDDLAEVRAALHRLQRPGIAPARVYAHDWREGDLVLFHNRGVLHSVVGAFADDEVRLFRQCNLAASHLPEGPLEQEVADAAPPPAVAVAVSVAA